VPAAAGEVGLGRAVTLEAPIEARVTIDNPDPAVHEMTGATGDEADPAGLSCVIAPLRLTQGTGSPVNPIAIL